MYWKPARQKREGATKMSGTLHLCQAKSNRGRRGRKNDFADGERMVKRLVAQELVLSFVPDPEQRLWRTVTRRKYQLTRDKVRFQNQLESLLEQAHKLLLPLQMPRRLRLILIRPQVAGRRRHRKPMKSRLPGLTMSTNQWPD